MKISSNLSHASKHLTHPKYRPDIDGLRAVAVLPVVAFHAFPNWVKSGFIGVDIFFVISGYLISTVIIGSLERNSFSFVEFYSRRIRRIFPALLMILITCFVFGWFALLADEYKQLGKHIAGGAGFISNFLFWNETGYFDKVSESKPLLHLWSLGIEEQFYLLWPLFLWFAWKRRLNLLTIAMTVGIISFVLNIYKVRNDAVAAFFSPQTRFWELMAGSTLAYLTEHKQNIFSTIKRRFDIWLTSILHTSPEVKSATLRNIQSVFGAVLIIIGVFIITKERHFPGWWAVLPTLGAALIISAGAQAWLNRVILSNRVLVWFGLISFPLYLWHWPLLSFGYIVESGTHSNEIRITAILISIVLAWLTYRLIEKPIRFGKHGKVKAIVLLVLMVAVGYVGYNTFEHSGYIVRFKKANNTPQFDMNQFAWMEGNHQPDCVRKFGSQYTGYCRVGNVEQDVKLLLLGDSNADHLFPGLNVATKGKKNLLFLGQGGCAPFLGVSTRLDGVDQNCQGIMATAINFAAETQSITTVILSMMGAGYTTSSRWLGGGSLELRSTDDLKLANPVVIFETGMRKTLQYLTNANKHVIFVVSTPRLDFQPRSCINNETRPFRIFPKRVKSLCGMSRAVFEKDNKEYRDLIFRVSKDFPNVKVFDTSDMLCDTQYCWAMKDGKMLFRDDVHLSISGSEYIASELVKLLP